MGHQCCGSDQQDEKEVKSQCCSGENEESCCEEDHECGCGDDCDCDDDCDCGDDCDCDDDSEHACGCGCGDDSSFVTLTDAEGNEKEYRIIGSFDCEEEEFIALLDEAEEQVYLFSFVEDGDSLQLKQIEDQEKFERVSKAFNEMMA